MRRHFLRFTLRILLVCCPTLATLSCDDSCAPEKPGCSIGSGCLAVVITPSAYADWDVDAVLEELERHGHACKAPSDWHGKLKCEAAMGEYDDDECRAEALTIADQLSGADYPADTDCVTTCEG